MYIMSYFTQDETAGIYLAASKDLLHWNTLNEGKPVIIPEEGYVIRDPFLLQDPEGTFHALFTDNWKSRTIGYSQSKDLLHWTAQRHIPLMEHHEGALNCWAPEAFFNREKDCYCILWSSGFEPKGWNVTNRIWMAETKDFIHISKPYKFFDPGYVVIDATVLPEEDGYRMAFKDERGTNHPDTDYKAIRTCYFQNTETGFEDISGLLTDNLCEGPCLVKKDGIYYMFYDSFFDGRYRVSCSKDFKTWEEITERAVFPYQCRHMSIIQVSDEIIKVFGEEK